MTPTEAAWFAGYVDGDGCITIERRVVLGKRRPLLIVDSADVELIEELVRLVGGYVTKKTRYKAEHRQAFSWRLTGANQVISVLKEIRPFMRCKFKCARADMLIEGWRRTTPRNGFYTAALKEEKELFDSSFRALGVGRGRRQSLES